MPGLGLRAPISPGLGPSVHSRGGFITRLLVKMAETQAGVTGWERPSLQPPSSADLPLVVGSVIAGAWKTGPVREMGYKTSQGWALSPHPGDTTPQLTLEVSAAQAQGQQHS